MSQIHAAAVFIQRKEDDKILAILRSDNNLYGLPCGKVDKDELPAFAAIRECFEETGKVAFIYLPSAYSGLDDSGNVVKTYRAEIVTSGTPTHQCEGEAIWISANDLVYKSKWGEYNRSMLAHFGIEIL